MKEGHHCSKHNLYNSGLANNFLISFVALDTFSSDCIFLEDFLFLI